MKDGAQTQDIQFKDWKSRYKAEHQNGIGPLTIQIRKNVGPERNSRSDPRRTTNQGSISERNDVFSVNFDFLLLVIEVGSVGFCEATRSATHYGEIVEIIDNYHVWKSRPCFRHEHDNVSGHRNEVGRSCQDAVEKARGLFWCKSSTVATTRKVRTVSATRLLTKVRYTYVPRLSKVHSDGLGASIYLALTQAKATEAPSNSSLHTAAKKYSMWLPSIFSCRDVFF